MGEPAYQLPDEDQPDIRPHLHEQESRPNFGVINGGGESTPRGEGHLRPAGEDGEPNSSKQGTSNDSQQSGDNKDKDDKKSGLTSSVAGAATAATPLGKFQKLKGALWGSKVRRSSTISGGLAGLLIGAFSVGSLWFAGPLEIVHVAQFITKQHLQEQNDAGDGRMGRLYRYVRSGGDAGETRLGWLGSHYKTQMISDLEKIGLKPVYGEFTTMKGFEIDTKNKESPYYGMDEKEVKAQLKADGITSGVSAKDGKVAVTTEGFFQKRTANRLLVKKLGYEGVASALRIRILNKYSWVTWHPLKKLDQIANKNMAEAYKKWKAGREEQYKTGVNPADVDASKAGSETRDANGKVVDSPASAADQAAAGDAVKDPTKSSQVLEALKGGKLASGLGGLAAAQGVVCSLKALGDGIYVIRYAEVVLPLIRMSSDALTIGNQVMSGQDVDAQTVKFFAKNFVQVEATTHATRTWNQAESIQAAMGNTGGIGAPEADKGIGRGLPGWLSWTKQPAIGPLCSNVAVAAGGGLSLILGIASGETISTIGGFIVSALATGPIMSAATGYLAGQAVNVAATGAEWGSNIDYGGALFANGQSLQFGGSAMSPGEVAQLDNDRDAADQKEFASKSFAYRVFNPKDNRTLASKVIDSSPYLQPKNVATTVSNMATSFGSILKIPGSLLFAKTHAAAPYDYGFDKFGYSQADLDNPLVADPYANAEAAGKILDGPDGKPGTSDDNQTFIDRANTCFGMTIQNGEHGWEVFANTSAGDNGTGVNIYADTYPTAECRGKGDNDWLRVRFFVFDMGEMEGWACYHGDTVSCQHDGVEDSATDTGAGANLRIASFNVEGASHTGTYKDRMDRSVQAITSNQINVVGLQELQSSQRSYMLSKIGGSYDIYPKTGANQGHRSENSVIWDKAKFSFVEGGIQPNLKYFDGAPLDAPWVRLQDITTGQQFYVLNTHDPANTGQYKNQQGYRLHNANEHVSFIKKLSADNIPIFYTGDFNSGYVVRPPGHNGSTVDSKAENLTYCVMTSGGTINDSYDVYKNRPVKCPNPQTPPDSGGNSYGGIDHVYVSKEVQVPKYFRVAGGHGNDGSDHPVMIIDAVIPQSGNADLASGAQVGKDFVGNDGFGGGWCTDYVKYILRRHSTKYRSGSLGDGKDVASSLHRQYGYRLDHTPAIHAVVSFPGPPYGNVGSHYAGHVALVAQINKDGSIVVEESNFSHSMAYGTHVVKAGEARILWYAHTEVGWH